MPATHSRHARRDEAPAFDPKLFYTFSNPTAPQKSLSAGMARDSKGATKMTDFGSLSSENWQIFFQSGRYFIRNYDYGASMQLGLTDDNKNVPKLYPRSGSLSQQWTVSQVNGGWQLVNGLLGPGRELTLPSGWDAPGMINDDSGMVWNITGNPSAAKSQSLTGDWINSVSNFETATSSVSPTATSSTSSNISTNLPDPRTTILAPTISFSKQPPVVFTALPTSSTLPSTSSPSLAAGAIAGIAIGGVVLLASTIFAIWFLCLKKKKQNSNHGAPYEVPDNPARSEAPYTPATNEKYAHAAELATPPVELASSEVVTTHNRAELDSSSIDTDKKLTR